MGWLDAQRSALFAVDRLDLFISIVVKHSHYKGIVAFWGLCLNRVAPGFKAELLRFLTQ